MDRFSPNTIATLIGHALYDLGCTSSYLFENLHFLFFSSVNTSSRQQQMCNITSGMIANYVAATRGSFVQKNLPFV